jgi:hypothetical protein
MTKWFDSRAFQKRLKKLPAKVKLRVEEAIETDAEEWVRLSKALVPKDPIDGIFLEPSIRSYKTGTGGMVVRAGGATTTKPSAGGPYDYGLAQEFGAREIPAQPYFWPAYRSLKKRFLARRKRALKRAIKEI